MYNNDSERGNCERNSSVRREDCWGIQRKRREKRGRRRWKGVGKMKKKMAVKEERIVKAKEREIERGVRNSNV